MYVNVITVHLVNVRLAEDLMNEIIYPVSRGLNEWDYLPRVYLNVIAVDLVNVRLVEDLVNEIIYAGCMWMTVIAIDLVNVTLVEDLMRLSTPDVCECDRRWLGESDVSGLVLSNKRIR